ncbi:MAG: YihY/virulence factor BrkB family protein [Halomonadaceae bacterium]|nr:MAG: YihY/virulence factor BrkB family protein [Halomonadaceae bacterium]
MGMFNTRGLGPVPLIKRAVRDFMADDMMTYAAALAYRGLFSLFPFLLFLIAMLSFLNLEDFFQWLHGQAAMALPPDALAQVDPVIHQLQQDRSGLFSLGVLVALWSASFGIQALMNAMNKAYKVEESRPFWQIFLLSIGYTVGVALLLILAAALMILGPQIMERVAGFVGMGDLVVIIWTWVRWPVAVLLMMTVVAWLYYVCPDVKQEFRFITPGSILAVIVWIAASVGFGIYVQNFGDYDAVYGSIGAIIILLLFFYISAAVLLFGAELNSVIEHASVEGKDPGQKDPNEGHPPGDASNV